MVRRYFGEKIAIYFAWLGFYTAALVPVALLGWIAVLYGIGKAGNDAYIGEICGSSYSSKGRVCQYVS